MFARRYYSLKPEVPPPPLKLELQFPPSPFVEILRLKGLHAVLELRELLILM